MTPQQNPKPYRNPVARPTATVSDAIRWAKAGATLNPDIIFTSIIDERTYGYESNAQGIVRGIPCPLSSAPGASIPLPTSIPTFKRDAQLTAARKAMT